MQLNEVNDVVNELDEKNRSAILKLIDLKTETDMEKVLEKFDSRFAIIDSKFDSKFNAIDNRLNSFEQKEALTQKLVWGVIVTIGVAIATAILLKLIQ